MHKESEPQKTERVKGVVAYCPKQQQRSPAWVQAQTISIRCGPEVVSDFTPMHLKLSSKTPESFRKTRACVHALHDIEVSIVSMIWVYLYKFVLYSMLDLQQPTDLSRV